jgi:hypothetical protein
MIAGRRLSAKAMTAPRERPHRQKLRSHSAPFSPVVNSSPGDGNLAGGMERL